MNPHFKDAILGRIKKDAQYSVNLIDSVEQLYRVGETLDAFKQKFASDRLLSEAGRRAAVGEAVRTQLVRRYATASRPIRTSRKAIAVRRTDFDVAPVDKADVVGEMRRREVRDYLRGLPVEKRPMAAMAIAADETLGRAILDAPAEMCGLGEGLMSVYETATKQYRENFVQAHFGDKLREIEAADEDYAVAEQMANTVRNEMLEASGLTQEGFAALLLPIEAEVDRT